MVLIRAYNSDICVGSIACRLEKKEGGAVRVCIMSEQAFLQWILTIRCLAPYHGLGIGTKLLSRILDLRCKQKKISEIYLHVQTNNKDATSFYKKFGFEITETIRVTDQKYLESSRAENKESTDKGLSATATAYAPSNDVSSKAQEKTSCSKASEGATASKMHGTAVSRARTGSSASSTSECGNAASASGLSPTSSMASLTSEKSTLNPHAKEFRLNPNAKSFVPSQPPPFRASSPVSNGSFYYPANVAPVPHMHGMPVGIGMGPSFPPHQPVIYGPQGTPLQSPQAYFHPNGPQVNQAPHSSPLSSSSPIGCR